MIKLRAISFAETDMFVAILNINESCPELMFRLLEESISHSENIRKKKEANEIYLTQEEFVGIKN